MGEIIEVIPKIVKDTAESVIEEIEEFSPTVLVKKDASIWLSYKKTIDENYKITLVINFLFSMYLYSFARLLLIALKNRFYNDLDA